MQIAVIGGGAAGIGAAWGLSKSGMPVTLFEREPALGGHCLCVVVPTQDGGRVAIDVGVSDFNRKTFANAVALFQELGLPYKPVGQDASFMSPDGQLIWHTHAGQVLAGAPFENEERFLAEIARFREECVEVLTDPALRDLTLEQYLNLRRYSREFCHLYIYPRAQGSFPMPDKSPRTYGAHGLIDFWRMHGIIGKEGGDRNVLIDGMHSYGRKFVPWLEANNGQTELGCEVIGVARRGQGVRVRYVDANKTHGERYFDHAVFAVRAHQVIPLLEDSTPDEREIFADFLWQRARVVVHQDRALMPGDPQAWGAYNYAVTDPDSTHIRPTITFYPAKLAGLQENIPQANLPDVFVTVNPLREPDPAKIISNNFFSHPAAGPATELACARVAQLQGRKSTWFCGSYITSPWVHEQAIASGVEAAELMRLRLGNELRPEAADPLRTFFSQIPMFKDLGAAAIADMERHILRMSFHQDDLIFRQNDVADGLYIVMTGKVEIWVRSLGDGNILVARHGAGSVFGETALVDDGRRSASARAAEPAIVYFLHKDRLAELQVRHRKAASIITGNLRSELARRMFQITGDIAGDPSHMPVYKSQTPLREPLTLSSLSRLRARGILASFPGLSRFGGRNIDTFLALCEIWDAPRNTLLFEAGAPAAAAYFILRGAVRSSISFREGRRIQLLIHPPGSLIDPVTCILGEAHLHRADVREDAVLLKMEKESLAVILDGQSELREHFLQLAGNQTGASFRVLNRHVVRARSLNALRTDGAGTDGAGHV